MPVTMTPRMLSFVKALALQCRILPIHHAQIKLTHVYSTGRRITTSCLSPRSDQADTCIQYREKDRYFLPITTLRSSWHMYTVQREGLLLLAYHHAQIKLTHVNSTGRRIATSCLSPRSDQADTCIKYRERDHYFFPIHHAQIKLTHVYSTGRRIATSSLYTTLRSSWHMYTVQGERSLVYFVWNLPPKSWNWSRMFPRVLKRTKLSWNQLLILCCNH